MIAEAARDSIHRMSSKSSKRRQIIQGIGLDAARLLLSQELLHESLDGLCGDNVKDFMVE